MTCSGKLCSYYVNPTIAWKGLADAMLLALSARAAVARTPRRTPTTLTSSAVSSPEYGQYATDLPNVTVLATSV